MFSTVYPKGLASWLTNVGFLFSVARSITNGALRSQHSTPQVSMLFRYPATGWFLQARTCRMTWVNSIIDSPQLFIKPVPTFPGYSHGFYPSTGNMSITASTPVAQQEIDAAAQLSLNHATFAIARTGANSGRITTK